MGGRVWIGSKARRKAPVLRLRLEKPAYRKPRRFSAVPPRRRLAGGWSKPNYLNQRYDLRYRGHEERFTRKLLIALIVATFAAPVTVVPLATTGVNHALGWSMFDMDEARAKSDDVSSGGFPLPSSQSRFGSGDANMLRWNRPLPCTSRTAFYRHRCGRLSDFSGRACGCADRTTCADSVDDGQCALLGVMGAFVFAAQMINFPVGLGTSGHLIGSALLTVALGPAAAAAVMTAILAVQAFVFQDGGVLALGANVFDIGYRGTLAAYAPIHFLRRGRLRTVGIAAGAFLSVAVSATLALSELLISGVRMPGPALLTSLGLFAASGVVEAAITIAVVRALERLHPRFVEAPRPAMSRPLAVLGVTAVLLAAIGVLFASTTPRHTGKLGQPCRIGSRGQELSSFADARLSTAGRRP